jgi:hypothetical protein
VCIDKVHVHTELAHEELERFAISFSRSMIDIAQFICGHEEMLITPERIKMREQIVAKLELAVCDR